MIVGAMNNPHKKLNEEIMLFGEMNFHYVELTLEPPYARAEQIERGRKSILDALGSYNLGVQAHMPWYIPLAFPYERVQKALHIECAAIFRAAASLGAKRMTIHPLAFPASAQGRKMRFEQMVANLKELHKTAADVGLDLLVENMDAKMMSIDEFQTLFSTLDMGMTLDVGHTHTAKGEGFRKYWEAFAPRVRHVHLHDNLGNNDDHLPLGAGKMDVPKVVETLKSGYDGTITLEVHSEDRHYLEYSKERLEVLWYGRKAVEADKDYLYPPGHQKG